MRVGRVTPVRAALTCATDTPKIKRKQDVGDPFLRAGGRLKSDAVTAQFDGVSGARGATRPTWLKVGAVTIQLIPSERAMPELLKWSEA